MYFSLGVFVCILVGANFCTCRLQHKYDGQRAPWLGQNFSPVVHAAHDKLTGPPD